MWNYCGYDIRVYDDGMFKTTRSGCTSEEESFETMKEAKAYINFKTRDYYEFSHKDIDAMFKKLSDREKDMIRHWASAYECHIDNAYCELGDTIEDFSVDFEYLSKKK